MNKGLLGRIVLCCGVLSFASATWAQDLACDSVLPDGVIITPSLSGLPTDAAQLSYVNIGQDDGGSLGDGWGPIEPYTHGGSWGQEDNCRVIWNEGNSCWDRCAFIDLDFGASVPEGTCKYLAVRWLDGFANDGIVQGANDSFHIGMHLGWWHGPVYTVHDWTVGHAETWYDLCGFEVPGNDITGVQTVSLCAQGGKEWAGFATFGQVAFSGIAVYQAPCGGAEKIADDESWVHATVELVDVEGPVTRCVEFTPCDENTCGEAVHVDVLCCGTPATGDLTLAVTGGPWTHLVAKDEQHTLSATTSLTQIGSRYGADEALSLKGGDSNADDVVDIDDVTWLMATFGDLMDGGTHPWDGTRDADFSANGFVDTEDYAFLVANWLSTADSGVARAGVLLPAGGISNERIVGREVKTSVPVDKLVAWVAARADLNGDGCVDLEDVKLFEDRNDLGANLSSKMAQTCVRNGKKDGRTGRR